MFSVDDFSKVWEGEGTMMVRSSASAPVQHTSSSASQKKTDSNTGSGSLVHTPDVDVSANVSKNPSQLFSTSGEHVGSQSSSLFGASRTLSETAQHSSSNAPHITATVAGSTVSPLTEAALLEHNQSQQPGTESPSQTASANSNSQPLISMPIKYSERQYTSKWASACAALSAAWNNIRRWWNNDSSTNRTVKTLSEELLSDAINQAHNSLTEAVKHGATPIAAKDKQAALTIIDSMFKHQTYGQYLASDLGLQDALKLQQIKLLLSANPDKIEEPLSTITTSNSILQELDNATDTNAIFKIINTNKDFLCKNTSTARTLVEIILAHKHADELSSAKILNLTVTAIQQDASNSNNLSLSQLEILRARVQYTSKVVTQQQQQYRRVISEGEGTGLGYKHMLKFLHVTESNVMQYIHPLKLAEFHQEQKARWTQIDEKVAQRAALVQQRAALVLQKAYRTRKIALHDTKIDAQQTIEKIDAQIKQIDGPINNIHTEISTLQAKMVCIFDPVDGNVLGYRINGKIIRNTKQEAPKPGEAGGIKALSGRGTAHTQGSIIRELNEADIPAGEGDIANRIKNFLQFQKAGVYVITIGGTKQYHQVTRDIIGNPNKFDKNAAGKLLIPREVKQLQLQQGKDDVSFQQLLPAATSSSAQSNAESPSEIGQQALPHINDIAIAGVFSNYKQTVLSDSVQLMQHIPKTLPNYMTPAVLAKMAELGITHVVPQYQVIDGVWVARDLGKDTEAILDNAAQTGQPNPFTNIELFFPAIRDMEKLHEVGVVHRDLKPGNLFLGADGQVRISDLDFMGSPQDFDCTCGTKLFSNLSLLEQFKNPDALKRADTEGLLKTIIELSSGVRVAPSLYASRTAGGLSPWGEAVGKFVKRHVKDGNQNKVWSFLKDPVNNHMPKLSEVLDFSPQATTTA